MGKQDPQIKFPDDPIETINKKLDRFFWILFSVGFVFVITLIVMVATLVVDSFHFNSATYKEYSQKTESFDSAQNTNKELLNQNIKNQQVIIEQEKQIQQLLNK
jgi:hypothetical protein